MTTCPHTTPAECWKRVRDFSGYDVSCQGRVRSWRGRRLFPLGTSATEKSCFLEPTQNAKGYWYVTFGRQDEPRRRVKFYVQRLVAFAFLGEPVWPRYFVGHMDADKGNNRVTNLKWVSNKENSDHRHKLGTQAAHKRGLWGDEPREQKAPF